MSETNPQTQADRIERQQERIDQLEEVLEAIGSEVGIGSWTICPHCTDGVLIQKDEELVCTSCEYVRNM